MLFNILSYIWQSPPTHELRVSRRSFLLIPVDWQSPPTHELRVFPMLVVPYGQGWQSPPTHELRGGLRPPLGHVTPGNPRPRTNCGGDATLRTDHGALAIPAHARIAGFSPLTSFTV